MLGRFSFVWLFATLWTVACQAPLSTGFSRREYWSELPCPPPGIFLTQGSSPALRAHCLPLSHRGSPDDKLTSNQTFLYRLYFWVCKENCWKYSTLCPEIWMRKLGIFYLCLLTIQRGVIFLKIIIVNLPIFLCSCIHFCFMYFKVLLWGASIFRMLMSSWLFYYYEITFLTT